MAPRPALTATLLALLAAGCGDEPAPKGVVARVGDAVLTEAELLARLPDGAAAEPGSTVRAQLVEHWVELELLYREAVRRKLDERPAVQERLGQTRRDLLVAALLDDEVAEQRPELEETAIQRYYESHTAEFERLLPEVQARHILFASQREAAAKYQALQRGESFERLAREHSLDPDSRLDGGELGYFTREQEPELWSACVGLPLHQVSGPIRTESGYHLIEVLDRQEAGTRRPLGQIRGQVVEAVVRQWYRDRVAGLVGRLKQADTWSVSEAERSRTP
ncbi:MAG: peptidylprolyl isomerase [Candidatus Latescibacterota bacterium]